WFGVGRKGCGGLEWVDFTGADLSGWIGWARLEWVGLMWGGMDWSGLKRGGFALEWGTGM
ncbi:hypothetical protein NDU88_003151, partial [Pleurodeles waltl]